VYAVVVVDSCGILDCGRWWALRNRKRAYIEGLVTIEVRKLDWPFVRKGEDKLEEAKVRLHKCRNSSTASSDHDDQLYHFE
jgi:hypothetical protein